MNSWSCSFEGPPLAERLCKQAGTYKIKERRPSPSYANEFVIAIGSLREVRTLTRRILGLLNADPRQELPRGTVAPLRGRDRVLLRLVRFFYHTPRS
jgi:hypothetical protein